MKGKVIVGIVFIAGLLIFTYPIISNWFSSKEHHTVISEHNEVLAKMTEEEKEKERQKATEYNESLNETAIPIVDPFSKSESAEKDTSYYNVLDIGETIGSLEIPKINIKLPIYHGVGDDVLQRGVGHMSNSSFPVGGKGTHTALTGHRGLPSSKLFRNLDKLEKADVFYIKTLDETLAYEVNDIQIVLPHEVEALDIKEDKDYVTLITCEPYMINTHRLLVRGERIPYNPEDVQVSSLLSPADSTDHFPSWIIGIGATVGLMLVIYYLRRKYKQG